MVRVIHCVILFPDTPNLPIYPSPSPMFQGTCNHTFFLIILSCNTYLHCVTACDSTLCSGEGRLQLGSCMVVSKKHMEFCLLLHTMTSSLAVYYIVLKYGVKTIPSLVLSSLPSERYCNTGSHDLFIYSFNKSLILVLLTYSGYMCC